MYFCVLGVRDLQYVARKNLFAAQIYKCFTAWVVIRLLASHFKWTLPRIPIV